MEARERRCVRPFLISAGIKKFLAGGMLLSLPYMAEATMRNLIGGSGMTAVTDWQPSMALPAVTARTR